jgi:co-chaperonin GroES (HSP10)
MAMALAAGLVTVPMAARAMAQDAAAPAAAAPHQAGTVKASNGTSLTLTTAAGQDVTVLVPQAAKVLVVAPGSKDLKSATTGSLADVTPGDRVLVTGTAGDTTTLTATRVILMKSQAIAATHAAEDAAWAQGGGGIVKSVDAAAGKIVVASGLKTLTVTVTPATIVRRYSGDSVRFADAKMSTIGEIRPGDQLRVRGTKSADGASITADELVTGTFRNYSGLIASVDASAGTITLKDLATKKTVTVAVNDNSDVRRLPPMVAARVAMQMKGGAAGGSGAPGAGGAGAHAGGAAAPAAGEDAEGGARRASRAGTDLSQMLSRLPTETLAGLKAGDAVMIVATSPSAESDKSTAVTLLVGVEAILSASPSGQTTTLSPWSLGGGEPADTSGGGGGQGGAAQHAATPQ